MHCAVPQQNGVLTSHEPRTIHGGSKGLGFLLQLFVGGLPEVRSVLHQLRLPPAQGTGSGDGLGEELQSLVFAAGRLARGGDPACEVDQAAPKVRARCSRSLA